MKTKTLLIPLLALSMLAISCNFLTNVGAQMITPSDVNISENRDVSGFNAVEFNTFGKLNIMQGDVESLNISGPDNLVPEIRTTVRNGTLVIDTREGLTVRPVRLENPLTFTLVVKELTALDVSGLGEVQIEPLSTPRILYNMSGAGSIVQNQLSAEEVNIDLSGLGGIELSGQAIQGSIEISGAGSVDAANLQLNTATVNLSGLGGATVWVTDQLSGSISGAGGVSYYGNPQTSVESSGIGSFKSLGNK